MTGQSNPAGTFGLRVRSVSEVTRAIRDAVRADDGLRDLWVEGEVGRVTISTAGHAYFTLKDECAQLQCVWFRDDRVRSAFQPQTGLRVVTHGRMDLYEPNGGLQLYVDALQPSGFGDLAVRFEELKARLAAEGLFDRGRKRPLPGRPGTIAVITSPSGAVWRDVCHVLARRWPLAEVLLVACQVQGEGAAASIVSAFRRLERHLEATSAPGDPGRIPAVTILARGGGSLEDLWPFNDERVVRAVVGHPVPVVCGVGHETDVTLADFAADVRAPTPSAAAELVVPDRAELLDALATAGRRARSAIGGQLQARRLALATERRVVERADPVTRLATTRERIGVLADRAAAAARGRLERDAARLARVGSRAPAIADARLAALRAGVQASGAALAVLGPQATLDRGYAIVRRAADAAIVREPAEAPAGTALRLTVARGELAARAEDAP
ncbi:MAG TPA: exodeoxyribonuclease VII large subunit [Candidatus Limnocylindrales bacterium]|nr:exodeoxyribonuclease VII large subunit [Candidatus Limnocylindrales bacterium]